MLEISHWVMLHSWVDQFGVNSDQIEVLIGNN